MKYEAGGRWRAPSPVLTPELPSEPELLETTDLLQQFTNLIQASENSYHSIKAVQTAYQYLRERNADLVAEFNLLSEVDNLLQNSRNGFSFMSQQNGESNLEEMLLQKQLDENEYWSQYGAKPSRDAINALHRIGEQLKLLGQLESETEPLEEEKGETVTYTDLFSFGDSNQNRTRNNDRNLTQRLPPIHGRSETVKQETQLRMTRRESWNREKQNHNAEDTREATRRKSKSEEDNNYEKKSTQDRRNSADNKPPGSAPGDLFAGSTHGVRVPHPPASPKPTSSDRFLRRRRHSATSCHQWNDEAKQD